MKEGNEKVDIKLNIQKTKIMASSPITSWQIDGETVETVTGFILLGSKITADGNCSHEIKRCLLLGRKALTNLSSVQFSHSVVSDRFFATPWTAAHQASLSIASSQSLLKLMSIESVIPSNHLIPFSYCFQSFPASGYFPVSGQRIGVSALASVLPMNIQD